MKKISCWAKAHPWKARLLIIGCYILINIMGIVTGRMLDDLNFMIPSLFLYFFLATSITGFIVYPSKKIKGVVIRQEVFYIRQKSCDFVMVVSAFFLAVYGANHFDRFRLNYSAISAAIPVNTSVPIGSSTSNFKSIEAFKASLKNKGGKTLRWSERRKLLKTQLKEIRKSDDLPVAAKIALTIACVLVVVGISTLVAAQPTTLPAAGQNARYCFDDRWSSWSYYVFSMGITDYLWKKEEKERTACRHSA